MLQAVLEHVFLDRERHDRLEVEQWHKLLGFKPATMAERLLLFTRLTLGIDEDIDLPDGQKVVRRDLGKEPWKRTYGLLPDGTPFAISLLVTTGRGRRPKEEDPLRDLPGLVLVWALRGAFQVELEGQKAHPDWTDPSRFRPSLAKLLHEALTNLGIRLHTLPDGKSMRQLRERLEDLVPNQRERQKRYDQGLPAAHVYREEAKS